MQLQQRKPIMQHAGLVRAKLPHKMTEDSDQSRRVTFENNLSVGGLRQKAEMQVKLHLTLS